MQSPAYSAAQAISDDDFFAPVEIPDEETFESQATTSNRMPLMSGHLYYQQLHRMRKRRDTMEEIEIAQTNRFHVLHDNQAETGAQPPVFLDSLFESEAALLAATTETKVQSSARATAMSRPETLRPVSMMRKNVLEQHPAVVEMRDNFKQEESNLRSQRLVDQLVKTVMAVGHDAPADAPVRPSALNRRPMVRTVTMESFSPVRRPGDSHDFVPSALERRPEISSTRIPSANACSTALPAMTFRASNHACSSQSNETIKGLLATSRLSPAAAAIRHQQALANPIVDPGSLRGLVEQTRQREERRVTSRLAAMARRHWTDNFLVAAIVDVIDMLKDWREETQLRTQILMTYFSR